MSRKEGIYPDLKVNFAVVARTKLKHVQTILEFIETFPDTKIVFRKPASLNKLWIKEDNVQSILTLEEEKP